MAPFRRSVALAPCLWLLVAPLLALPLAPAAAAGRADRGGAATPPATDALAAVLRPLSALTTAGATAAVYFDGRLVWQDAYGFADVANRGRMTGEHRVLVGSLSKQFTAWLILQAAAEGRLSLDDPVRAHVPELPDAVCGGVRLHHLMHHTSGLRDITALTEVAATGGAAPPPSPAAILAVLARQSRLRWAPGSRYGYSNSNHAVLGVVLERAYGTPLRRLLRTRVWGPLGMNATDLRDDVARLYPTLATSTTRSTGPVGGGAEAAGAPALTSGTTRWTRPGSTGVLTTPADLARWDANWLANTLGGGADLVARAQAPWGIPARRPTDTAGAAYAAGWNVVAVDKATALYWHAGADGAYRALYLRVPRLRLGLFLGATAAGVFPDLQATAGVALSALRPDVFGPLPPGVGGGAVPPPPPPPPSPMPSRPRAPSPTRWCATPPAARTARCGATAVTGVWVVRRAGAGSGVGPAPAFGVHAAADVAPLGPPPAAARGVNATRACGGSVVADLGGGVLLRLAPVAAGVWAGRLGSVDCGVAAALTDAGDLTLSVDAAAAAAAGGRLVDAADGGGRAAAAGGGLTLTATRPRALQVPPRRLAAAAGTYWSAELGGAWALRPRGVGVTLSPAGGAEVPAPLLPAADGGAAAAARWGGRLAPADVWVAAAPAAAAAAADGGSAVGGEAAAPTAAGLRLSVRVGKRRGTATLVAAAPAWPALDGLAVGLVRVPRVRSA